MAGKCIFIVLLGLWVYLQLAGCAGSGGGPSLGQGLPKAYCADSVINLGAVRSEETVERMVYLCNRGAGTLQYEVQRPDCDCLSVRPMRGEIAAGDSARVRIAFSARGFYGPEVKRILVAGNGERRMLEILLFVDVKGEAPFGIQ
ncbi:MAG: DUF1573 domain-containing protein [Bacteroidia bacterium]|nr:DUF1573 domain-containing protein [Bacteroidia bacterium]